LTAPFWPIASTAQQQTQKNAPKAQKASTAQKDERKAAISDLLHRCMHTLTMQQEAFPCAHNKMAV
jgi:hypothetical protein